MKHRNTQCLILCSLACIIYGLCHGDWLLAGSVMALLISSYIFNLFGVRSDFPFLNIPWSAAMVIALVVGSVWRLLIMPSEYVHDLLSFLIAILQSAIIFMIAFSWIRKEDKHRSYYLQFQAWTSVALSINIYLYGLQLITFIIFCAIGLAFILYNSNTRSENEKTARAPRGWKFYSLPVGVYVLSFILGALIAFTILVTDRTFIHLVNDYNSSIDPNHFLKMNSFMKLDGPGRSGSDIRPVLTMSRKKEAGAYLITQIFDRYENGIWKIHEDDERIPLPPVNSTHNRVVDITMFTSMADVIPVPKTIIAAEGKGNFFRNGDDIVLTDRLSRTRKVRMAGSYVPQLFDSNDEVHENYLKIPRDFKRRLNEYIHSEIGVHADPYKFSLLVQEYFRSNFSYTLNTNFQGDQDGLMYMLWNKHPSYCTYFASAMALILRAQGVPSRIMTGFLVTEKTGHNDSEFLARVRDGHAWVEALVPNDDGKLYWRRFDPTPGSERQDAIDKSKELLNLADQVWLWSMRLNADIQELDWNDFKKPMLFVLILILAAFSIQRRFQGSKEDAAIIRKTTASTNPSVAELLEFYRQLSRYIEDNYGLKKHMHETNGDFLNRLFETRRIPTSISRHISDIYMKYTAARFGHEPHDNLHKTLEELNLKKSSTP